MYPRQAGPLFHSYVDLTQVARWSEVGTVDLRSENTKSSQDPAAAGSGWGALLGRRPDGVSGLKSGVSSRSKVLAFQLTHPSQKHLECVVPCYVSDSMCTAL